MKYLDAIDQNPKQFFTLIGEKSQRISFFIFYMPSQQSWYFNLSYGDVTINGAQLTVGPNILRGYRRNINFGLACLSTDGLDPFYLNDFVTGRIKLILLNETDVDLVEAEFDS